MTITEGLRVDVAFEENPDSTSPRWYDVTPYVRLASGLSITRGRSDVRRQPSTGSCSLTLDNSDGRFTSGKSGGPYGAWVIPGRKLRVTWRPDAGSGNLLAAEDASFEGGTTGAWVSSYFGAPASVTLANSTTRASHGSRSLRITFPTAAAGCGAQLAVQGLAVGRQYTLQARVYVPAGVPAVSVGNPFSGPSSVTSTVTNAWQTLTATWTPTTTPTYVVVRSTGATTSGQQVWVDSLMIEEGSIASTFTTSSAVVSRFTGHVESWPTEAYPVRAAYSRISAYDRKSALGYADEFRSVVEQSILNDSVFAPVFYYPLLSSSEDTSFGSVSTTPQPSVDLVEGPEETFDATGGTGPPTDGSSSPAFTPEDANNGSHLYGRPFLAGVLNKTLRASLRFDGTSTDERVAVSAADSYGTRTEIGIDGSGYAYAAHWDVWLAEELWRVTSSSRIDDNRTHSVAVRQQYASGTTAVLTVDGVDVDTDTSTRRTWHEVTQLTVGASVVGFARRYWKGTIAHVAGWQNALGADIHAEHHEASTTGYEGERSDERIARYATWAGVATAEQSLQEGYATIGHVDTTGLAPISAMEDIADTEGGALIMCRDGLLKFLSRRHNLTAAPALTVVGNDEDTVTSDASLRDVVNDVTIERAGGGSVRVTDESSILRYRRRFEKQTLRFDTDAQAQLAAENVLALWAHPRAGIDRVTVDVGTLPDGEWADVLEVDFRDKLTVNSLPTTPLPAASFTGWVEGYTENIGVGSWRIEYTLTPMSADGGEFRGWILDDATWSVLGSTTVATY